MKPLIALGAMTFSFFAGASERPPAVAGSFYSDDPDALRSQVVEMLASPAARTPSVALVVPHAGYVFSGAVAGRAFSTLDPKQAKRVILLGPSHHDSFAGGALPARRIEAFSTPLGGIALDRPAVERLRGSPLFDGPASAHGPEHCLEVELPFLQVAVPDAKIVPILVGARTDRETARRMAQSLAPLLDEHTVVVVSSDFTHHGDRYGWTPLRGPDLGEQLVHLGRVTAGRLAAVDPPGFAHQIEVSGDTVCGAKPAMVLMELLAGAFTGAGRLAEVTTSGHRTGSWDLSVTYASVVFHGNWKPWTDAPAEPPLPVMNAEQGAEAVALAV